MQMGLQQTIDDSTLFSSTRFPRFQLALSKDPRDGGPLIAPYRRAIPQATRSSTPPKLPGRCVRPSVRPLFLSPPKKV